MALHLLALAWLEVPEVRAGAWTARIEAVEVSPPGMHVQTFRQTVLRRGPGEDAPVALFEETAPGWIHLALRDDGLLLVRPVREAPRLYFPGSVAPVDLQLPAPTRGERPFGFHGDVGDTWFLGDVLLYSREPASGHRLIGFVSFDVARKVVVESRACVEVLHEEHDVAREAKVVAAVRVGDRVVWANDGVRGRYPVPETEWKTRKLRALSLASCATEPVDAISESVLAASASELRAYLRSEGRRAADELEIWVVETLADVGERSDAALLRELSAGTENDRKRAYEEAVRVLESRPPR